jgi:putative spermidine/putrescine transport system substrate-binding protein
MPKGASNQEATMDFVKFSTGTKPLADQASWIPYGPLRKSSFGLVGAYHNKPELDMAPHMPTAPDNFKRALQNDFEFWADNSDQLNERFNAWLTN